MAIHRPKKSLGQNFLKDPKILRKIAEFAHINIGDTVVEIGPGQGSLTQILLEKVGAGGKVIAVEKDAELVSFLKERFKEVNKERLEIIEGDILNYNLPTTNCKLVGNIPYYITGEIFRKFLGSENKPKSITFVIQKEVADRIMARDNKESILSISVKAYGTPEYGGIIKAGSFSPAPKVDSAIIGVRNIGKERWKDACPPCFPRRCRRGKINEKKFFEIVKKGFAHKRKLLINNLGVSKGIFDTCGIPEKARAEDLELKDWICLLEQLG